MVCVRCWLAAALTEGSCFSFISNSGEQRRNVGARRNLLPTSDHNTIATCVSLLLVPLNTIDTFHVKILDQPSGAAKRGSRFYNAQDTRTATQNDLGCHLPRVNIPRTIKCGTVLIFSLDR